MTQECFSQYPALCWQVRKWGNEPLGQDHAETLWQSEEPHKPQIFNPGAALTSCHPQEEMQEQV